MGLEELTNIRNVERLKKELRVRLWNMAAVRIPKSCLSGSTIPSRHWNSMGPGVPWDLVQPWNRLHSLSFFLHQASYCLIDSFLGNSELIGDLTQCVDCVIPPEGSLLQVLGQLWK